MNNNNQYHIKSFIENINIGNKNRVQKQGPWSYYSLMITLSVLNTFFVSIKQ